MLERDSGVRTKLLCLVDALLAEANRPGVSASEWDQFSQWIESSLRTEGDLQALAAQAGHLKLHCVEARARQLASLGAAGDEVEKGRALWSILTEAVERLRPASGPAGHISRAWRQYRVLHDAYLLSVPNWQIAWSLAICERTFDRDRRKAIMRVSQIVWEMEMASLSAAESGETLEPPTKNDMG